jgi:hypothetical protein
VRTPSRQIFQLDLAQSATVGQIKSRIEAKTGIVKSIQEIWIRYIIRDDDEQIQFDKDELLVLKLSSSAAAASQS